METNEIDQGGAEPTPDRKWKPSWLAVGALAAGLAVGAAGIAGAATGSGSSGTSGTNTAPPAAGAQGYGQAPSGQMPGPAQNGSRPDPSTMANGPGETLLAGDDATKATDAALAAVPGATVIRVETDSSGDGTDEAHLRKSDGTQVTVLMDSSFKVVSTVDGFGGGPKGQNGPPQGGPLGSRSSTTSN